MRKWSGQNIQSGYSGRSTRSVPSGHGFAKPIVLGGALGARGVHVARPVPPGRRGRVRWTGLPLPGAVVGMLLLLSAFAILGGVPDGVRAAGDALLGHLMLLLVPATAAL